MKKRIKEVLREIKKASLMAVIGWLIIGSASVISIILEENFGFPSGFILIFLSFLIIVGVIIYYFKKEKKLISKKYWIEVMKGVMKSIREKIETFFNLIKELILVLLFIVGVILIGLLIFDLIGAIGTIGTIPFLLIIVIYYLIKIEERLKEKNKYYDDNNGF